MKTRIARSIADAPARAWNALAQAGSPFLRHEFMLALERSRCATPATGWDPHHLLCYSDDGSLRGFMPLYLKNHSWGEFVFDFAWAEAYHRCGLRYYPRLVSAVPFTPATGPRLVGSDDAARKSLLEAAREILRELDASSLHVLFPADADRATLADAGLMTRVDVQYHWRNDGYASFEDFLAALTAEKRKKIRRERRRVAEAGVECRTLHGGDLDAALLDVVYRLHACTFARYGNAPYLNREFFGRLADALPEALVVELAFHGREPIACAVSLRGSDALYGRYWGASRDFHSLHFELCYYRGIEYCIRHGLARFEPGTQGEHKLVRGFAPAAVWSAHEIADPHFARAIGAWLERERTERRRWLDEAALHLPFRSSHNAASLEADVRDRMAAKD